MRKLKLVKDVLIVGRRNIQTLGATRKLELLRREMGRFRYDIIGIPEVLCAGIGETSNDDLI